MNEGEKTYMAIDLKSFYASVECVERGLDPLNTHLVVADESRTDKTICLAVSPSLKNYGIGGRARLFEAVQAVNDLNRRRQQYAPNGQFRGKSYLNNELRKHPDWEIDFIRAVPRMALYIQYSTRIYQVYLKYIAAEDIHVYSIDEVLMDVSSYLRTYKMTAKQLASTIVSDILAQTGITATAGIGSNLYLAKVAMDILAKHATPDQNGVRIAELDEMTYRQQLWGHKPLTSFWRIGRGIAHRLEEIGIDTMGKLARYSLQHEDRLYKVFGVNAELIIDHAWGWESCTIAEIKAYKPETNSMSNGQVLTEPYTFAKARNVVIEMADNIALSLVEKRMLTDKLTVAVNYDHECLTTPSIAARYTGEIVTDHYGRMVPKPSHASIHLGEHTSSSSQIISAIKQAFDQCVQPELLIRRITIVTNNIIPEDSLTQGTQLSLFSNDELMQRSEEEIEQRKKERQVQETLLSIKQRFGKNAILKGINYADGATGKDRNSQIGGHKA